MINEKNDQFKNCMSTLFSSLRGHGPYWQNVKLELKAHTAILGCPTWFLTLNPDLEFWTELHDFYSVVMKKQIDAGNIREVIAQDPALFSRHFHRRLKHFVNGFLYAKEEPIGKIIHHFIRIEYQHRGTQHAHCLLWAANGPKEGEKDKIVTWLNKYVTARLPDQQKESELYTLVNRAQRHWPTHSKTCQRIIRHQGKRFTICRFEFPRPAVGAVILYNNNDDLRGKT